MSGPRDDNAPVSDSAAPSGDDVPDRDVAHAETAGAHPPDEVTSGKGGARNPQSDDPNADTGAAYAAYPQSGAGYPQGGAPRSEDGAANAERDAATHEDADRDSDAPDPFGPATLPGDADRTELRGDSDAPDPFRPATDAEPEESRPAPTRSDAAIRPCAYCGRAVPQPGESGPPARYCLDNEGACARAAADRRRRDQNTPGLARHVARTWDMVERLEDVAELLAISLTAGLSVAGVERRTAEARADAAASIALAHRDREAARLEAERMHAQIGAVRDRAQRAEARIAELSAQLAAARTERDMARDMGAQAARTAEAANAAVTGVRDERDRLTRRLTEFAAALDAAREEAARCRAELAETMRQAAAADEAQVRLRAVESELHKTRIAAQAAQTARAAADQASAEADRQALEARSHAEEMSAERDATRTELESCRLELESCRRELEVARGRLEDLDQLAADLASTRHERDESQSRLIEHQLQAREHAQTVDQLRGALAAIISERDAAHAAAREARAKLDELTRGRESPPPGARHARPSELGAGPHGSTEHASHTGAYPLPPGHDLGGVTGSPESFRGRLRPPADE